MAAYVRTLIERAPGRAVLQFNRIDIRLACSGGRFRTRLWCTSSVTRATSGARRFRICASIRLPRPPKTSRRTTTTTCVSGRPISSSGFRFSPSETPHPYQTFYYIWKLSYWFGAAHAHHSLSFEQLTANPVRELEQLFRAIGLTGIDVTESAALVTSAPAMRTRVGFSSTRCGVSKRCTPSSAPRYRLMAPSSIGARSTRTASSPTSRADADRREAGCLGGRQAAVIVECRTKATAPADPSCPSETRRRRARRCGLRQSPRR